MRKGFMLKGIITTGIVIGAFTFSSPITVQQQPGLNKININSLAESIYIGRILKAESESESDTFSIKKVENT